MRAIERQLKGYRLTTAEILYYMPDHPSLLQSMTWQHYDMAPHYPVLKRFLAYWHDHIEARIHSVAVASRSIIGPAEMRLIGDNFTLH